MTALQKAQLYADTFPKGVCVVNKSEYQLDINFNRLNRWLTKDEESLLTLLGAFNVFAFNGGWGNTPLTYTGNLNTCCGGSGWYCFEDDETESLPIPLPELELQF
jgi:hypothetical protein